MTDRPLRVSAPALNRQGAHRPSGASGGSCRPHRGQRRDRWVTVSDITLGSDRTAARGYALNA